MDERVRADVACLVDSPYRTPLLSVMRDGPTDRGELRDAVDASRATVSRGLETFEDRGWVEHSGQTYQLTKRGRLVAAAVADLEARMTTARDLEDVIEHVPLDELGFDIRHLEHATVIRPRESDPMAPIRHANSFIVGAETASLLSRSFTPGVIDAIEERGRAGERTEVVVTTAVVESLTADSTLREQLESAVAADAVTVGEYRGDVPHVLAIADGTVSFGVMNDEGHVIAVIDSEDDAVLTWARAEIERYCEEASELTADRIGQVATDTA